MPFREKDEDSYMVAPYDNPPFGCDDSQKTAGKKEPPTLVDKLDSLQARLETLEARMETLHVRLEIRFGLLFEHFDIKEKFARGKKK